LSNPRRASDDPGSPAARLAAKARYFGLKLRTPLDFAAVYDTDGRLEYDAEQNVTEVQLADFSPELALTLKKLIASIVAFHGTFFGAHTRYHVRPVLFAIDAGTTAPTLHE